MPFQGPTACHSRVHQLAAAASDQNHRQHRDRSTHHPRRRAARASSVRQPRGLAGNGVAAAIRTNRPSPIRVTPIEAGQSGSPCLKRGDNHRGAGLMEQADSQNPSEETTPAEVVSSGGREEFGSQDDLDRVLVSCGQLVAEGDLAAARLQLRSLEAVVPNCEQQWKHLHSLCLTLNERTLAQVYTERFLRLREDSAAAHMASARNFMSVYADRQKVQQSLAAALLRPGPDAPFWREVAEIQYAIQDHKAACESVRRAITTAPDDPDLRELLLSSMAILRRTKEIRNECSHLASCLERSETKDPLRWARLARITAEAGYTRQARGYIDLAVEYLSDTTNYGADFELIRALILTGQTRRAGRHLESLQRENSQNIWLWKTLLDTAMSRRCYSIALIVLRQLKALPYLDPESAYRISLTESIVFSSQRTGLKHFLLRWISPHS